MLALREEAVQLVNEMPENLLADVVKFMRDLKNKLSSKPEVTKKLVPGHSFTEEEWQEFLHSGSGLDPKKAAAFARLEEWRKKNKVHLPPDTDWKKEIEEAICEKYGIVN